MLRSMRSPLLFSDTMTLSEVLLKMCFLISVNVSVAANIKLGMLSPFRHVRLGWENNAAAATIAIEKAQRENLLVGHNISVVWKDDKCNSLQGAGTTVLLRDEEDVDVFIGPPCSSATTPAGLLASFWNMPIFSQASSDPSLANKGVYKTLVRLGPPFNKMGNAFVEVFKKYKWKKVVIVSRRKTDNRQVFCDYSTRAADEVFRSKNITVVDWMKIGDNLSNKDVDDLLNRISSRGRNHLPPANVQTPWLLGKDDDNEAKEAYKHVFQITVAEMAGEEVENFRDLIPEKMMEHPWYYNKTKESGQRGSVYSPFLHDVVYLYLLVLNETLAEGQDYRNGTLLFEKAKGKSFAGVTGTVKVDQNGDRDPDYWLWYLNPDKDKYEVVIDAKMTSQHSDKIHVLNEIIWGTKDNKVPPDTPKCGFLNENCQADGSKLTILVVICAVLAVLVLLIAVIVVMIIQRRARYQREVDQMLWKVEPEEINLMKTATVGSISQMSLRSIVSSAYSSGGSQAGEGQVFSVIGTHKGNIVSVRKIAQKQISLTRNEKVELKIMKDLSHENVNLFIGLCIDSRRPCFLTTYCNKGSLQDIIENDDIKLDAMFKTSLVTDLLNGLVYIHHSPLRSHGNLKSANCLVDNRWVLKVTDYGMKTLRHSSKTGYTGYQIYSSHFWTAPELLPVEFHMAKTQKADMYSFAIILFELFRRTQPYDTAIYTPQEIIQRVKNMEKPLFRPITAETSEQDKEHQIPAEWIPVMMSCWDEDPEARPTSSSLKHIANSFNNGKRVNIVDNMIQMLERYANNLEELVEQRTHELIDEKKKTDMLLHRMLPSIVAEELKHGRTVAPEIFYSVTIYFSDIVGFTALSSTSTAIEIVDFLNDLYTAFDAIVSNYGVYKVETIGDAYMVVSGLPVRNGNEHVSEIADMSLDLLAEVKTFVIQHRPESQLQLRIGLHSGPCAAGVVGKTMPRYCLFGDTVNMASRMESSGEALKIHISQSSNSLLQYNGGYITEERGNIEIKGKGIQTTYWLLGKTPPVEESNVDL